MDLKSCPLDGPGRGYLVGRLRDRDYSLDVADWAVRMVFDEISEALGRGEDVELPFGYLKVVRGRGPEAPFTIKLIPEPAVEGRSVAPDADLGAAKLEEPLREPERVMRRRPGTNKWERVDKSVAGRTEIRS